MKKLMQPYGAASLPPTHLPISSTRTTTERVLIPAGTCLALGRDVDKRFHPASIQEVHADVDGK
jgi:hypothetical protein